MVTRGVVKLHLPRVKTDRHLNTQGVGNPWGEDMRKSSETQGWYINRSSASCISRGAVRSGVLVSQEYPVFRNSTIGAMIPKGSLFVASPDLIDLMNNSSFATADFEELPAAVPNVMFHSPNIVKTLTDIMDKDALIQEGRLPTRLRHALLPLYYFH